MKRPLAALLAVSILLCPIRLNAAVHGQCAPAKVTPVPGDPGAFRIETAHGSTIARRQAPAARAAANTAVAVFRVFPVRFDADGDTLGTEHDTILVAPGTVVRWVRAAPGFHTVTNGADSGDPLAATEYSLIFDDQTNSVELTFTAPGRHDFFCFIHEPNMEGSIIVTSATADVSPPGVIRKPMFSRPPAPNPSRGGLSFAVALPHAAAVRITAHDIAGRTVATIADLPLPAGEHPFQWNGRGADGRLLQSGRYFIRLAAGGTVETRAVSLIH
jgi:plastocyanin